MATNFAVDGDDSKVVFSCKVTPDVKASTNQYQQGHMMKNNEQKDICSDDAVDNDRSELFENFSIRDYAFSVRAKDIQRNWPFSLKYLQICLENGRQPLLPPFESHKDVIDQKLNQKENSIAVNVKHKTKTVPDSSNNKKVDEPKNSKKGRREGWIRKQKSCKRKKRMVPGKDLTSTEKGKECNIIEDIVHVDESTEAKGDPKEGKEISTYFRQNDDKDPEAERVRVPMNSCESKSTDYVANTDIAHISDSGTGGQKNHTESGDMHLTTKNGDEVRKKKGKKVVTSEHKPQEDDKEQNVEKNKEESGKNDDNGNSGCLPDALITKVCPVCRTFSSTSNTALNAHIDHCLSIESNCKRVGNKCGKPKVKSIKKRSLAEICAVAPLCTLEDLERHILEDQSATEENQMPLGDLNSKGNTKQKRHQLKAESAHRVPKGKKLQKLSNLKEQCQTEKIQKKFPKKRKRVVSTTSLQCAQDTSNVPESISEKKKVYARSSSEHDLSEDVLEDNLPCMPLVSAFVERPTVSGSTRVDTKEEMLAGFKQDGQEQESYNTNNGGSTDVLEKTSRNPYEEELLKSSSKSAVASCSEVNMTMSVQTINVRQAEEILAKDFSPLEFSEISRHTSRLNSQSEMKQSIPRNESASGSPTLDEGSGPHAESARQASSECLKSSTEVTLQCLGLVEQIQPQPNSVISTSYQDSQIPFSPQETPMIGHLQKRISINVHNPSEASTEMPAHPPGVPIQDPTDEIEQVPALHEVNERIFSPLISCENLNPSRTLQRRVVPQNNSETQCFGISDAAKERVRSISLQRQTLRQNPATQNDTSCLSLATDASELLIHSNRQFSSLTRDSVLPNILHATSDICGSSSSAYLCNGLLVQQPNLNSSQIPSISSNINSNNMWTTETEHSSSRNMKERLQSPVQKLADVSGYAFGHSVCSSSSISCKGPTLSFQGNLLQNRPLQSKDSQYLNQQSSFGSMKLASVTVPQVVSASTLAKQLDEGKTPEEILHGCIMIEQNPFNFQFSNAVESPIHSKSMFPLENQIESKHKLNNPLFGLANGSYGPNQVVGVAPYAHSVQKSCNSNRSFTSGFPCTSGAVYSSGLSTNQGQSDNICVGNMDCSAETSMFGNPILRLMGKNLMVTNEYGKQPKQLDANPTNTTEYPNVSYLRLLGFTSGEKNWQDDTSLFGRSIDSSITFDQNMFSSLEGLRSQESRSLWNQNDYNQKSTYVEGNISESFRNFGGSTSQKIVDATLPNAGLSWSHSNLVNSNIKFPLPPFQLASVENRTSSRPIGADYQAKRKPQPVRHSQLDDTVIVIDDSPDLDTVPNMVGLESAPFSIRPGKFQEGNATSRIPGSDSMFSLGKTWPPTSSLPSHFSGYKESTTGFASNLQRAKAVQEELRRLGITNTRNSVKPSYVVHSQSGHEVIIIDDTPDTETVSTLPQPRQFQEGHPDSKIRSGNTWLQVSSMPNKFSACKESTLTCGLNHQRAKEVQEELRRLGITNPGIVQSSSAYLTPMRGG